MEKKRLEYYKKKLLKLRESLVEEIKQLEGRSLSKTQRDFTGDLSGYSFHMADVATVNQEREKALNLRGSEENLLYKVDQALYRIEKKIYGLCIPCQRKIDKKRLNAIPYAELCIKCQAKQEKTS
ncbi:MAG TPA: TraR/DksA family transcriptional regulator [bacterium]|nr:TraR/DksA family transcriptional regulator [bacterium]